MSERSSRPLWLGEDARKWDHVRLHVQVIKDWRLGAYHQAVYAGIACHAEVETGEARPSAETLAAYARCSERQVRRIIEDLENFAYLAIEPRQGKASIYRLLPPPPVPMQTPASQSGVGSKDAGQTVRNSPTPDSLSEVASIDPGTSVRTPRTQGPDTPDSGSDELEPRTRTKNYLAPKARERDEIWDTLTAIFGEPRTPSQTRLRGKHVKELKIAAATPDEIHRQSRLFTRRFENATLTEPALVKWFGQLEPAKPNAAGAPVGDNPRCKHGTLIVQDTEHGLWSACGECSFEDLEGRWAS